MKKYTSPKIVGGFLPPPPLKKKKKQRGIKRLVQTVIPQNTSGGISAQRIYLHSEEQKTGNRRPTGSAIIRSMFVNVWAASPSSPEFGDRLFNCESQYRNQKDNRSSVLSGSCRTGDMQDKTLSERRWLNCFLVRRSATGPATVTVSSKDQPPSIPQSGIHLLLSRDLLQ